MMANLATIDPAFRAAVEATLCACDARGAR